MNLRGLVIAVVVLVGLGGALYWSQHRTPAADHTITPNSSAPVIVSIDPANVSALTIRQKESVTLKKLAADTWQISQPKIYPADSQAVATLLSSLSALHADRVVDERAVDRKQYGLDPAAVELDITDKNGHQQQLLLGDDTPAGGDIFAALGADPRVFTIASYNKSSLGKSLNDLRDKKLLTVTADEVSRVELIRKGGNLEFDRTKDGWQILKPSPSPADSNAVNDLVRTLTAATMDLASANDATVEFARSVPLATAKLTGSHGMQTLEVRKNKDDYYAKSSQVEGRYKVEASLGQVLSKKVEDFRKTK